LAQQQAEHVAQQVGRAPDDAGQRVGGASQDSAEEILRVKRVEGSLALGRGERDALLLGRLDPCEALEIGKRHVFAAGRRIGARGDQDGREEKEESGEAHGELSEVSRHPVRRRQPSVRQLLGPRGNPPDTVHRLSRGVAPVAAPMRHSVPAPISACQPSRNPTPLRVRETPTTP
jgi:hypothetical protein